MNTEYKYDVFISYSRKDYVDENKEVIPGNPISLIKEALKNNNISCWFDENGIFSGDEFAGEITKAIRESRVFVFISSRNSNALTSIWTSNEISVALEYGKIIIPFRIDNSPYNDQVMMKIISLDYIDGKNLSKALVRLVSAIRHHLQQQSENNIEPIERPQTPTDNAEIVNQETKMVYQSCNFKDLNITLIDKTTPLVVFVGLPTAGKTTSLYSLVRYIRNKKYTIVDINRTFRNDSEYKSICDSFESTIYSNQAPLKTTHKDSILIDVFFNKLLRKHKLFQIMDTSGSLFTDNYHANDFPLFFYNILNIPNHIIWVYVVDLFGTPDLKLEVEKINKIKRIRPKEDKAILLSNKIDLIPFLLSEGKTNEKKLREFLRTKRPQLMTLFEKKGFFSKYLDCTIIPFQTGVYQNGSFVPAADDYPKSLWETILSLSAAWQPKSLIDKIGSFTK